MSEVITEKALLKKWEPLINHKNAPKCESYSDAVKMARILEEQEKHEKKFAKHVLSEANYSDPTGAAGVLTTYKPILVPMMRRIVSQLISMKIFGVQPMSGPSGVIFVVRPGYQNSSASGTTRKTSNILILADATAFAVGDPITGGTSAATGTVLYKENNTVLVSLGTTTDFVVGEEVDDAAPFAAPETTVSARFIPSPTNPQESNEALYRAVFRNYSFFTSVLAAEQSTTGTKEMSIDVTQTSVIAQTQKLKAKYSLELQEDYNAIHGEDAESDLIKICSDELVKEQNLYFIDYAFTVAERNPIETFNYNTADGRWLAEKAQNAVSKITVVGKDIATTSRRGVANHGIATKKVINLMEDSGRFEKKDDFVNMNGMYYGKLDGGMDIYYNLDDPTNYERMCLGFTGGDKDAGIYFAPYIGLTPQKTNDPENGNPVLHMRTRYGLYENPFGAANYYREIRFSNIP